MGYTEVETTFYRHMDGRADFERLVGTVAREHEVPDEDLDTLRDRLTQFINVEADLGFLQLDDKPADRRPLTTGVLGKFYPHMVNLEITGDCDQHCVHCYRESGGLSQSHMSYEHVRSLFDAWRGKIAWVHITGGEPTANPQFCQIVEDASNQFRKVSVVSNGAGIDRRAIDALQAVEFVQISLFGTQSVEHDAVTMRNGSFHRACKAVELLSGARIPHAVSVVLDRERAQRVEEFVLFARKMGAEAISFGQLSPVGRGKELDWALDANLEQRVTERLLELKERYADSIRVGTWGDKDEFIGSLLPGGRLACGAGELSVAISEVGNVRPCEMLPRDIFFMGNVIGEDISDIIERNMNGSFDQHLALLDRDLGHYAKAARNVCEPISLYLNRPLGGNKP